MFKMHERIIPRLWRAFFCALGLALCSTSGFSDGLTLEDAEQLALGDDPGLGQVRARQRALDELSVAAGQLPDPQVKLGLVALPTDTFHLGQEPMTQVQVGVMQKFPRGESRELASRQLGLRSEGLDARARDQALQIRLAVREHFIEVLKQQRLGRINADAIGAFTEVADITRDYYGTGRGQQQDVLQAAVEVAKAEDRASRIAQREEQARARLAAWVGDIAFSDLADEWPELAVQTDATVLKQGLVNHPRVRSLQKSVDAAETGVALARQRYKPEFGVDLTYGGRGGRNPDGRPRTDLLTFMLVMDVPLFTENRQDRVVAARVAESSAALYERDDLLRSLRSEVDVHLAALKRQHQRLERFEDILLPEAEFSSEASMNAFRSSVSDLTTLLRTRLTEFDLALDYARLRAEHLKTRARLRYLEGARS
jgi:outer membrane protein TolC